MKDSSGAAAIDPIAAVVQTPAAQSLRERMEDGGALSCGGIAQAAQSFFAVLLRRLFPLRPIVVVTDSLKTQEGFQQDIDTWLSAADRSSNNPVASSRAGEMRAQSDARSSTTGSRSWFYPAWENLPHEAKLSHVDVVSDRLETLVALSKVQGAKSKVLASGDSPLIVTNVVALLQLTLAPEMLRARTRILARGDRNEPLDLVEWLEEQGYEPEGQVTQKGEIALRGGILDVFPLTSPWPVRLEFFGDELESLRYFDPLTQISREEITSIILPPGGELGILKQLISGATDSAPIQVGENQGRAQSPPGNSLAVFLDYLSRETVFVLCEPESLETCAEHYSQLIPKGDPFFISWEAFLERLETRGMTRLGIGEWSERRAESVVEFSAEEEELTLRNSSQGAVEEAENEPGAPRTAFRAPQFQSLDAYRPLGDRPPEPQIAEVQRHAFFDQLHRWLRQGFAVQVFCNNDGESRRFTEIWDEYGFGETDDCPALCIGTLARGFVCDEAKLVVVTDAEIFGRYRVQRPRRLKSPHAATMRSALEINFAEMEEGDYVVHIQHGIGRYLGLKVLPTGFGRKGRESGASVASDTQSEAGQECLVIEYAPTSADQPLPKLYVPVTEAHLVSKYVGAGKVRPQLNTLGGGRWTKTKAQAEKAVRDLAGEFLSIQAARESQPGHAFKPDASWQREFEGSFIYEETSDQQRAINETKRDMETPKPMDRLICGDVGFGKTEVAIRASFKAVMDGRQVAVLVPTTVLAQQHYNTFRERMADYPIRIELLSRFRTRSRQMCALKDLGAGAVDIVIGTHRLVQEDVQFKELGLVVIDEEQRFGVTQKEKFKRLRKLVDVLTLSATPIPRTLYLALTGARDMSTIETPPHDRLPVETIVTQYDERVIRDAIQRELMRGGQVFFLHNRVMTIDTTAKKLQALVPKAKIVVGHGQMHADDLEEVMTRFVNGQADVLLSTTIIESGLDIPNANTIIIDRADRFGLSDLYQLRGRVGRYKHQAYAYLLLPRHAGLLADARKRISAIKQYSTLGSGFKIAMRDLEIRGAGNLLGAEQSGHITAVGFELYCQLLKQSISALKGEKVKPRIGTQMRLDFLTLHPGEENSGLTNAESRPGRAGVKAGLDIEVPRDVPAYVVEADHEHANREVRNAKPVYGAAYLPFRYIPEAQHRIDIYRKLAQVTDKPGIEALRIELVDRFGSLPQPVELLLYLAEIKILAGERGVTAIETKEDKLMLTRNNDYITLAGKFPRLTKQQPKARLHEIKKLLLAL